MFIGNMKLTNMGLGYYDIVMPTKGKKLIKK